LNNQVTCPQIIPFIVVEGLQLLIKKKITKIPKKNEQNGEIPKV